MRASSSSREMREVLAQTQTGRGRAKAASKASRSSTSPRYRAKGCSEYMAGSDETLRSLPGGWLRHDTPFRSRLSAFSAMGSPRVARRIAASMDQILSKGGIRTHGFIDGLSDTPPAPAATTLQRLRSSVLVKLLMIGFLSLALMIPVLMVDSLVAERNSRQARAAEEISRSWGKPQKIIGPFLSVPYHRVITEQGVLSRTDEERCCCRLPSRRRRSWFRRSAIWGSSRWSSTAPGYAWQEAFKKPEGASRRPRPFRWIGRMPSWSWASPISGVSKTVLG